MGRNGEPGEIFAGGLIISWEDPALFGELFYGYSWKELQLFPGEKSQEAKLPLNLEKRNGRGKNLPFFVQSQVGKN